MLTKICHYQNHSTTVSKTLQICSINTDHDDSNRNVTGEPINTNQYKHTNTTITTTDINNPDQTITNYIDQNATNNSLDTLKHHNYQINNHHIKHNRTHHTTQTHSTNNHHYTPHHYILIS